MEQKRILWITAAVGAFLLVVIGAALILYSPSQQRSSVRVGEPAITSIQSNDDSWVRTVTSNSSVNENNTQTIPVTSLPTNGVAINSDSLVPSQNNQIVNPVTDINGNDVTVISGTTNVYSSGTTTTIDLNSLKNGGVAQVTTSQSPVTQTIPLETKTTSVAPTEKAKIATAKATTSTQKASTNVSSTAKTTTTSRQYWVQAASFNSKKNAEEARAALTASEISGEVFTYEDKKGTLYYRVRVGPYTTASEAEYWKARIIKLDMFANSQCYVTNTSVASVK